MKLNRIIGGLALLLPTLSYSLEVTDPVDYSVDIPQTLSINSPGDATSGLSGAAQNIQWIVTSNNGVKINFTGTAYTDLGVALAYPLFVKQDKDASGNVIAGAYDHLDTLFGVEIAGHNSVQTATSWAGASVPIGMPENLVLALGATNSPDAAIGRIMPDDDDSTFTVTLHAQGTSDANDQSGDYALTVTAVATGSEV